jgi:hypothetical protein
MKTWIGLQNDASVNVETEEIAKFMQLLQDSEQNLKAIQQDAPVTFPWIALAFCDKTNRSGGCPLRPEGLCVYEHSSEICTWGKDRCKFGERCHKIHPGGAANDKILPKLMIPAQSMVRGASPAHTLANATNPCPNVNKPQGCRDSQRDACLFAQFNENRECRAYKLSEDCRYGDRCGFVHSKAAVATTPLSASGTPRVDRNEDLVPLLSQVLADPKRFRVCMWVNKPSVGCKSGAGCTYNHSLSGVECPDRIDGCERGTDCPLFHGHSQRRSHRQRSAMPQPPATTVQNFPTALKRSHDAYAVGQEAAVNMNSKRLRQGGAPQGAPIGPEWNGRQVRAARINSQQQLLQVPGQRRPAHGQQGQKSHAPFTAPKVPRTGNGQQLRVPQSPLNALQTASPVTRPHQAPRGPAQTQPLKQQQKLQPPPHVPKGPRGKQALYQAPPARAPAQQMPRLTNAAPVARNSTNGFSIRGAAGPDQQPDSRPSSGRRRARDDDVDMMDIDGSGPDAQQPKRAKHHGGKKHSGNHGRGR